MERYRGECGKRVSSKRGFHSLLQHSKTNTTNPGAGIDEFEPYETVLKDGFMLLDCAMDDMYLYGDKFGPNKHDYNKKDTTGVSIVLYEDHVAKEDRAEMTHKICFEFCRTVPDMLFFGLVNGRDCYCTPYYKPMESDSSECDATCPGEPTLICGGKSKSSIFEMHFCDSTAGDLAAKKDKASDLESQMKKDVEKAEGLSDAMQESGEEGQKTFGKAGDPAASDLMQDAKIFAGTVMHTAEDAAKAAGKLKDLIGEAKDLEGENFKKPSVVTKAERLMEDIDAAIAEATDSAEMLEMVTNQASPLAEYKGAADQYYPIMYFVDKSEDDVPSTCTGKPVGKPIVGKDMDGCAAACDALPHDCKGFSFFGEEKEPLCFLFSSFKSAVYYTGCDKGKSMFLEKGKKSSPKVTCVVKLSEFDGTTLKPDGSGKCKQCLKGVVEADRCY
eukprot:gnl/TRDRNA2_/TRDRNA2_170803_c1_seq1.p1 gnl/TRDRNA2_/TRDRNA2_170803_c1~~gnl/TRDRNA2_/TRDRNA2_170803_c1_seq1.p1  ORF type:complete len:504 (-),score=152.36 gnl/TRDRNA2_/TRDRNA2_170803_c1_seq1:40-1371(-)